MVFDAARRARGRGAGRDVRRQPDRLPPPGPREPLRAPPGDWPPRRRQARGRSGGRGGAVAAVWEHRLSAVRPRAHGPRRLRCRPPDAEAGLRQELWALVFAHPPVDAGHDGADRPRRPLDRRRHPRGDAPDGLRRARAPGPLGGPAGNGAGPGCAAGDGLAAARRPRGGLLGHRPRGDDGPSLRARQTGRGLPGASGAHRLRARRVDGRGAGQERAARLPAGALQRLHLCHHRRGVRRRGRAGPLGRLRAAPLPRLHAHRAPRARPAGPFPRRGPHHAHRPLRLHPRRRRVRAVARDGPADAVRVVGRHVHAGQLASWWASCSTSRATACPHRWAQRPPTNGARLATGPAAP